jgi:EamA domain-containing membrane protein RarD
MNNSNNQIKQNDTLSTLWQTQSISTIDLKQVQASLSSERTKQRWYMIIDVLITLPAAYVLYGVFSKYWGNMSSVAHTILYLMLISSLPLLVYQLWLRRVAAFYKDNQTADHLSKLTKQIKNNIKIAFITKHSTWVAMLFGLSFILESYFQDKLSSDKIIRSLIAMSVMSIVMLIWFIWAHKRQKRFEQQLETLTTLKARSTQLG